MRPWAISLIIPWYLERILVYVSGQAADITLRPFLVLEAELHGVEVAAFLPHPLLGPSRPQHLQILMGGTTIDYARPHVSRRLKGRVSSGIG